MIVPEQYPDTLTYGSTSVICRFIPGRLGNRLLRKQDGSDVQVKFDIAFPVGTQPIPLFTKVSGVDKSGAYIVYNEELLAFHIGQLHCKGAV